MAASIPVLGCRADPATAVAGRYATRLYTKVPSEMGWAGQPHARGLQAGIPVNANKQGEHIDQNRLIALQALQLAVS